MFRNIFDTIVGTISNLNPLKHFIKYALDKTLNQFLKKQLTLEDFKNGPLNLQNIQINTQKINKLHLVSSPYILHSGIIGNLKIILPPLSDLSTQSIQISISGVQIVLKPNKKFSENFKEKMVELHQMQKYYVEQKQVQGQISETGPVDFFKQLLKKIIINIKVNISNIAIKLYMNTPSEDKSVPQFYLMLRIPLIYLDKKQDKQIKKNQVEELSFNILLPQVTVHLLSQDISSAEYRNIKFGAGDFPFKYPTVSHPKTILLIGSSVVPENIVAKLPDWKRDGSINQMNFSQLGFKLTTDFKKKTKDITLHLQISNIQSMLNPVQIKILSRFVAQILQFKKILDTILQQLKIQSSESINLNLLKRKSNQSIQKNSDIFSSIMMSLSNQMASGKQPVRDSGDMFKSMMREDRLMRESVREFNLEFEKKLKQKQHATETMTVQFQVIQFKQSLKINLQFRTLTLYLLKYTPTQDHLRLWRNISKQQLINKKIGCDYFMFEVKKIDALIRVKEKLINVSVKSVDIFNVKLCQPGKQVSDQSFYDIGDSVDFQAVGNRSGKIAEVNQICQFVISSNGHYCVEEILALSQNESQNKVTQNNVKKYSLIPQLKHPNEDAYILYKPALTVHLDTKQKYFKINLQILTLTANLQLLLDLLNIAYPLTGYKRLADIVNFKRNQSGERNQQFGKNRGENARKNIFQSMYQFREDVDSLEDLQSQNKNTLVFQVAEAKIGFRKGEVCMRDDKGKLVSNFGDLIRREKEKIFQEQLFNKVCFCNVNQTGIYLQLQSLKLQKKLSALKLSIKSLQIGIMKIQTSSIQSLSSILSLKTIKPQDHIRILKQNTHCQSMIFYVPEVNARFTEEDIVNVAALGVDSIKIVGELLGYWDYLEREMVVLEKSVVHSGKKGKKSQGANQKEFKIYIERVFVELDYCSALLQQIYLNLNQQTEQSLTLKLSTISLGLNRQLPLKHKICEFRNQIMQTTLYPQHPLKHKQERLIGQGDIFMEICDKGRYPAVFKVEDRNEFFQRLEKIGFGVVVRFVKRDMECAETGYVKKDSNGNNSGKVNSKWLTGLPAHNQKFKFKQATPSISQQGQKKILTVQISKQPHINACNLLQLQQHIPKIQKFTNFLQTKIKQAEQKLKTQNILPIQRKHSAEIQSQSLEIVVKILPNLFVDFRPDFGRSQGEKVYSNTRSVVTLTIHNNLSIIIHKDKSRQQIYGQFSLAYHFLTTNDRQLDLHPLLLKQSQHLSQLGFKTILQLNKLSLKLNLSPTSKQLMIKIKSILGEASLETLCLMQLHFQHLVNHHVKGQLGLSVEEIYDGEDFQVLDYHADCDPDLQDIVIVDNILPQAQQLEIEDLTGALQLYQQKLNNKKHEETILRSRSYTFQPYKNPQISIEQLLIQKICFRISSSKDFDFIKSLGQSVATKRARVKEAQELDYYVLDVCNLLVRMNLGRDMVMDEGMDRDRDRDRDREDMNGEGGKKEMCVSAYGRIEKLGIFLGKEKHFGHTSLKLLQTMSHSSCFVICSNQNQICLIFEKSPKKILVKSYCLKLMIGGSTQILSTFKKIKQINRQIEKSGWRKIYPKQPSPPQIPTSSQLQLKQSKLIKKDPKIENQRIVILLPESTVKVTFQYANLIKIVDEQVIEVKEFILNEEAQDMFQIKLRLRKWVKTLAKNNLGSVIGGTALNLLVKIFSQLVKLNVWWLSKFLGFFFGGSE